MPNTLTLLTVACIVIGTLLVFAALAAFWHREPIRMLVRLSLAVGFLGVGVAAGAIAIGVQGYRAFTREDVVATVRTEPTGAKRFKATLRLPDGQQTTFMLAGDQLYVDARVLKWKPIMNYLGLHTAYELDRIGGRYYEVGEERSAPRTLFELGRDRPIDLVALRQRYALLEPLLDADYGSATFIETTAPAQFEILISTTGLLVRRVEPAS